MKLVSILSLLGVIVSVPLSTFGMDKDLLAEDAVAIVPGASTYEIHKHKKNKWGQWKKCCKYNPGKNAMRANKCPKINNQDLLQYRTVIIVCDQNDQQVGQYGFQKKVREETIKKTVEQMLDPKALPVATIGILSGMEPMIILDLYDATPKLLSHDLYYDRMAIENGKVTLSEKERTQLSKYINIASLVVYQEGIKEANELLKKIEEKKSSNKN